MENDCVFMVNDGGEFLQESNRFGETGEVSKDEGKNFIHSRDYKNVFYKSIQKTALSLAQYVANLSQLILEQKGKDVVLVSLATAGTPIGVLIKRYFLHGFGLNVPHYTISCNREKGLDENALVYILKKHQTNRLQFLDGWTGTGTTQQIVKQSVRKFQLKYDVLLDGELSVISDPSHSTFRFATRDDFLVPSACFDATITGLSTVLNKTPLHEHDYVRATYHKEWEPIDMTNSFVNEITKYFRYITPSITPKEEGHFIAKRELQKIQKHYGVKEGNQIKPGIGETIKTLLRNIPSRILIHPKESYYLDPVFFIAKLKGIPIEMYPHMYYACLAIDKEV
ncbi:tellurite-like stress resistance cysteine protease StiP (plasmid) [Aneurinibacillus sp. Ricciae_BoGa-3]|uniref:cysteine protease StiP domain-containing protein n=1 Tax=Aneurinibacillus sp. Ricciae_BoGa-3 TaxID=3022697 RepID=UPI0023411F92|nr:cysteine protease StiP domain-containing protein [Aneurinibacillus sp. Ricciae_BoGa-3]WCK57706.1 tellurite-like stress resistance cysteine protease StiP [Aneurinibacillus sp. Ricciae_BoGa-3]